MRSAVVLGVSATPSLMLAYCPPLRRVWMVPRAAEVSRQMGAIPLAIPRRLS